MASNATQQPPLASMMSSPASSSSKHKAKLLLKMANAVEDSSARSRQKLHDVHHQTIDAGTVDRLLWDLEQEASGNSNRHINREESLLDHDTDTPQSSSQRWLHEADRAATPQTSNRKTMHHEYYDHNHGIVEPQQVQLLYEAMIRYRENAELRYQLLELRHLEMSRSFVELETRYRKLETEQEAWKQSCQALQEAALEGEGSSPSNKSTPTAITTTTTPSSNNKPPQRNVKPSSSFQNSTVPILQQELKLLAAQRNQLLQANLELRKQLKQMQIQMQTPKAGEDAMTATCRRCHPELLAGRQQYATDTLDSLVEQFQSSTTSMTSHNNNSYSSIIQESKHASEEEMKRELFIEEDEILVGLRDDEDSYNGHDEGHAMSSESDDQEEMDSTVRREENKHEDKMNLLGMQWGGGDRHDITGTNAANNPNGLRGHKNQHQPIKQIVWSPSNQEQRAIMQQRHKPKAQMVPTLNSILPMHQTQQQQQHHQQQQQQQSQQRKDIQVPPRSPRREEVSQKQSNHSEMRPSPHPKEIPIHLKPNANQVAPTTNGNGLPVAAPNGGMDRFGLLDEYGRSISYRTTKHSSGNGGMSSTNSSNHSGSTVTTANTSATTRTTNGGNGMSRFRRKSAAAVPSQQQHQHQHQHQQQAPPQPQMQTQASPASTTSTPPHSRQRRTTQRHSIMGPPSTAAAAGIAGTASPGASLPAAANARHLEYHLPGNAASAGPSGARHSLIGAQPLMNSRHLEFSAPGNPSPSPMRGPVKNPMGSSRTGVSPVPGRRVAQPVLKRPTPPHDAKTPAMVPPTTRNYPTAGGLRNQGHPSAAGVPTGPRRTNSASNMRGGSSGRGPLMPNNRDPHHQTSRAATGSSVPSQPQTSHHQAVRTKNSEERKPERASRPQSYFERIKKTLQQEI